MKPGSARRALAIALVLTTAGAAAPSLAADFCMSSAGLTYVGKSFRLPRPGKCASWQGFILGLPGGADNTSTGTACASSADPLEPHVDFAITTMVEGGAAVIFDHVSLPGPTFTGGDRDTSTLADGFVGSFAGTTSKVACPTTVVPIQSLPRR